MLSAEKDANRATAPRAFASNGGAVGKVVNSIQSLRQRLTDYTLEEITDAENRSRTLLVGLSNLQLRLGSLAAIKESMTAVHEAIEQGRSEDFVVSAYELADQPLRVQDIVQASKLIGFSTRKKRSAQASGDVDGNASVTRQISPVHTETPQFIGHLIEAPPDEGGQETTARADEPSFVFDSEQMGGALPDSAANFSWDEEPGGTFPKEILDDVTFDPEPQMKAVSLTESTKTNDFPTAPEHDQLMAQPQEPNAPTLTALVPSGGDFDQRLLDDLIKNYGEFFSSANSRAKLDSQNKIQTEPASAKILEAPAIESAHDKTARALPLKKEGDINRQLKKIIKDYGEYDIYSRQSPVNLKIAIVGGLLLLGAIFFGFYFLSSSKSQESYSSPALMQRESMNKDTAGNFESKPTSEASGAKAVNKSIVVKK